MSDASITAMVSEARSHDFLTLQFFKQFIVIINYTIAKKMNRIHTTYLTWRIPILNYNYKISYWSLGLSYFRIIFFKFISLLIIGVFTWRMLCHLFLRILINIRQRWTNITWSKVYHNLWRVIIWIDRKELIQFACHLDYWDVMQIKSLWPSHII